MTRTTTLHPGPDLGALALEEYAARRDRAVEMRRAGAIEAARANALLAPWAALALRLADDPAALCLTGALAPLAEDWRALHLAPDAGDAAAEARFTARRLADALCTDAELLATLARARDAAFAALPDVITDHAQAHRVRCLAVLAVAMNCPATDPAALSRSAQHKEAA